MPDIRVDFDASNHSALKKMAIDSGLTLRRLIQTILIEAINKSNRKPKQ